MSEIFDVDCGYLATIQAMADRIWADGMQNIDLTADVEAARAVLENQQVNFTEILGVKKRSLSVEWMTKCAVSTTACTDDCEINGDDIAQECKTYEVECLRETTFKVPERVYREKTISMQEAIARNMLLHKKALDEWLAQYIVTAISLNAGVNQFSGGFGSVTGALTTLPASLWDDTIWGYLNRVIRANKFKSPYVLTGDNLYQYIFNRQHESMTEAGKAAMAKIGTIRAIYQDPENVEAVAPGKTFLINKTAVAFLSKAWYPLEAANAAKRAGNYWMWSEASNNIPGVYYDIFMMEACSDNDFSQAYKIQLHGLFAVNPTPCNDDQTGILAFSCL